MAPAEERREKSGTTDDPVHRHGPDDISKVVGHGDVNPEEHHPPMGETRGVRKILGYSIAAAIAAMVVIGLIAFTTFG